MSSLLYVVAALFLKQAAQAGVGVWRTTFICNGVSALVFLGLFAFEGAIPAGNRLWEPALVALLFLGGQLFTFFALDRGDVSVATPVLGAKVVLVAIFSSLAGTEELHWQMWLAALFSFLGIGILNRRRSGSEHRHMGRTILFALLAASSYAMFDVLVMAWSPGWGMGRFLPIMMVFAALYSMFLIPLFRHSLFELAASAWTPLLLGAFFIGLQGLILITTLARFGDATAVNVVYSSRGLWSVLAVWGIGHWFGNLERGQGSAVFRGRLLGAGLLFVAILLLFM